MIPTKFDSLLALLLPLFHLCPFPIQHLLIFYIFRRSNCVTFTNFIKTTIFHEGNAIKREESKNNQGESFFQNKLVLYILSIYIYYIFRRSNFVTFAKFIQTTIFHEGNAIKREDGRNNQRKSFF